MSSDGERNFLPIVAIVIFIVFASALTAGVVVWRRAQLAESASRPTSSPLPLPPPATSFVAIATPSTIETGAASSVPNPSAMHWQPPGVASISPISSGSIPNADHAIARLRPGFRSCYNKGLANDPSLQGSITIAIVVAANGDITDVTKKSGTGLSADVEMCILKRARNATFDASPSGGTVTVPIKFVKAD